MQATKQEEQTTLELQIQTLVQIFLLFWDILSWAFTQNLKKQSYFHKIQLPGLPQSSQILINFGRAGILSILNKSYHSTETVEVIDDHVEVFAFVEIIDLKEVLSLQPERFTTLQIELDVFTLQNRNIVKILPSFRLAKCRKPLESILENFVFLCFRFLLLSLSVYNIRK